MSRTTVSCLGRLLAICLCLPYGQRSGGRPAIDLQKQVLITIRILGNPKCLRSVAARFNITKSILFRVYRRICGAIANNLSGQYMNYQLVWNWAPQGKMINFGSFAQRNALDQWSNDPSLDRADQWSDESLSRVDLIDPWSENGFARKERHRWETLIQILPKERTLWLPPAKESLIDLDILVFWMQNSWKVFLDIMQKGKKTHLLVSRRLIHLWIYMFTLFMQLI